MVRKSMKAEIVDAIYEEEYIMRLGITDEYINRYIYDNSVDIPQLFARLGIIKNNFLCESCSSPMQFTRKSTNKSEKFVWKCKRPCRKETGIRKNSILESIKGSMALFLKFLLRWSRSNLQADMAHDLNVNKNTISKWSMLLRESIQNSYIESSEMLGGYDEQGRSVVVEIDESLFFKRKYNRGRYREAQWVFGLIERVSGKCVLLPVENRSAGTLIPLICQVCRPGTTIISDGLAAYRQISSHCDFTHLTVNHSINFIDAENSLVHTQNIENIWLHAKRALRKQFGCKENYLEGYLYEYIFKRKTPKHLIVNKLILLIKKDFE